MIYHSDYGKEEKNKVPHIPKHLVDHTHTFRCLICGKVVEGLYLNRHLLVALKIVTYNVKARFADLGTTFKRNKKAKTEAMLREYQRNLVHPKS